MFLCTREGQMSVSAVFLNRSPPSFYRGSITEPEAYQLLSINTNYPASWKDLLIYTFTALGLQACTATPDCFTWVLGNQTQVLMFVLSHVPSTGFLTMH